MSAVFAHSVAEVGARLTLLALAEAAQDDGVTWVDQATLAARTKLTDRQVRNCIRTLEGLGEIEQRKAQAGRVRFNVYRVVLPGVQPVNYTRLQRYGVTVAEPFTGEGRPERVSGREEADDRKSVAGTTGNLRHISAGDAFTRGNRKPTVKASPPGASAETVAAIALPDLRKSPSITRPDGRDPVFDALSRECDADPDARGGEIAAAEKKIARLTWGSWDEAARIGYYAAGGEDSWGEFLAGEVVRRAALYRRGFGDDVECTPTALAKWWNDVESRAERAQRRGLTASEIASSNVFGDGA